MALNIATLKTRTITAVIFAVIMIAGLLISHWTFFLLFSVIHFGCWTEYQKLAAGIDAEYKEISPFHRYGIMVAGWCFMLYFTTDAFRFGTLSVHAMGWWLGLLFAFLLPITELLFANTISLKNIGYSALGIVYISVSCGLMTDLMFFPQAIDETSAAPELAGAVRRTAAFHPVIPLAIIACMWINDTMAYLVGSLIGKNPLSPISPKKTWEGTIGGIILCVAIVALCSRFIIFLSGYPLIHWIIIPLIAAVTGALGDLFESKLKRMAGVKDSGKLMPGHGGFLDRFDSLLVAVPFVWIYVQLFMK